LVFEPGLSFDDTNHRWKEEREEKKEPKGAPRHFCADGWNKPRS
jgi:hypothetical protein